MTDPHKLSLVDFVLECDDEELSSCVQPAQWFITDDWSSNFLDSFDTLLHFFHPRDDVAVWSGLSHVNHHDQEIELRTFDWFASQNELNVRSIRNVVFVMFPWRTPFALHSSWCLFDAFVAMTHHPNSFQIASTDDQKLDFLSALETNPRPILSMLQSPADTLPSSFREEDQVGVLERIGGIEGFRAVQMFVLDHMSRWMLRCLDERAATPGESILVVAKWLVVKAGFLRGLGYPDDANDLFNQAMNIYELELGTLAAEALAVVTAQYLSQCSSQDL
ncbi:hypothetical protein DYB32_003757 [Aphanomyces invadans]|nr:hypothetical protein DYB32_003757 [Aphanomyces invadans]